MFDSFDTGDDGSLDPRTGLPYIEYSMEELFTWATTTIAPDAVDAPGTGNSHGWTLDYLFWWNVQSGRRFNFDDDAAPVINAHPYSDELGRFPRVGE
jgi:hypothetical protein